MTPPPALRDANGRRFALGRHLASGGEGAVFELPTDPDRVAKVYHADHRPDAARAGKLAALVALSEPTLRAVAAWPSALLYDAKTRQPAGFVMPRLADAHPIQHLYNPVQRLKFFPRAGWGFQVRAARNLAAAFDEVHRADCLMADVNQSNAFVTSTALVRLIDCDSFQVRANGQVYPCDVGTPHYIPPELQGKPLRGLVRTPNHDRFGLAVLIYQLLFVGRHPYAGVYRGSGDPSFEKLIAEFRFAQGPMAHSWGMAPPPHTPTFSDIPADLGTLFRRSFERGGETGTRPTPADWLPVLDRLGQTLADCKADAGHKFWRGAGSCVWCRLAANGGPEYYFGVADGPATFAIDEGRLHDVLRRLAATALQEFAYDRNRYLPPVRPTPQPIPAAIVELRQAIESMTAKRRQDEVDERRRADQSEAQRRLTLERLRDEQSQQLAKRTRILADRREVIEQQVAVENADRQLVRWVIGSLALLGCLVTLFAMFKLVFGLVGLAMVVVFGTWLGIDYYLAHHTAARKALRDIRSRIGDATRTVAATLREAEERAEAERRHEAADRDARSHRSSQTLLANERTLTQLVNAERTRRHRAYESAEARLVAAESAWTKSIAEYRREHRQSDRAITAAVAEARGLAGEYQGEVRQLTASAEAAARERHLRLHSIADATIPSIGEGRKQALADAGISTAADVDREAVRRVKGFGESLTAKLIAWQREIAGRFRFDPTVAAASTVRRTLAARYRSRWHQLIASLDRMLTERESLAPECRARLDAFAPELKAAVAAWAQAASDVREMTVAD